jgi:hypothetical protein
MTQEDKVLVFFKLRGGSGPIDAIREAADISRRWRSNRLAKRLVAAGLLGHPRNNCYVLTTRGDARAGELIGLGVMRAPGEDNMQLLQDDSGATTVQYALIALAITFMIVLAVNGLGLR